MSRWGGPIAIAEILLTSNNFQRYIAWKGGQVRRAVHHHVSRMLSCRTAKLGLHLFGCSNCPTVKVVPHSCKSVFCSSCGKVRTDQWCDELLSDLLEVPYRHLVFTLPWELRLVIQDNRRVLLNVLFRAAAGRADMSNAASGLAHLKPFLPGLEPLLEDAEVSEIMINGPGNVWIEAKGRLTAHAAPGLDESALLRAAIHIARPLGLDPATTPIIDARLDDGSRVAICVPPASPHVAITIRRFGKRTFSAADLVEQKALPENVLKAAEQVLMTRRNILVSGGTGSGKTTLLNALIELLPDDERIVAIEDTLELRIDHSNCVRFEARGLQEGAVTIRDLVRHALRHRPDHIVVGEVRGGEAADLLQALNTGHGGSLTTVHANNAESALSRIASCAMQGGGELPWEVTCRGVVDGIAMVIHMTRREGRRFVEEAAYVKGYDAKENQWDIQKLERISLTS